MVKNEPGWELYRSLLGVLDEGSLSGAARALGIAQPTVGRHVAALEKTLGQALFTRSQAGLTPTEAALELRPHLQTLAATAAAIRRVSSGTRDAVAGTVRITASEVVAVEVLPPILARLADKHPGLAVELVLSNQVQDLLRREADIAVRMTTPRQESLIARRVASIVVGLHAHRDYLERHGTPRTDAELLQHRIIGFDKETAYIRAMSKSLGPMKRDRFSLRTDSDLAQLAAIRAGHGIGICQVGIARRDKQLVRLMPRRYSWTLETWVTMHEDLRHSARCKAVFDALVEGLGRYAPTDSVTR
jgi:DNA-binding transcriptional LysR family regulator